MTRRLFNAVAGASALLFVLIVAHAVAHAQNGGGAPNFQVPTLPGVGPAKQPQQVAMTLQILIMLTILSVAPAILVMMTAFTRIVIVLSFVRSALGTQNIPPNQVLLGLALFLTFFIMAPTFTQINDNAVQPYMAGKIEFKTAFDRGETPLAQFMIKQTYKDDLNLFLRMSNQPRPQSLDKLSLTILVPAFVISELKTGFIFGFIVYIPFIIIDLVVSSLLMSMGMMMLPPTVISLPAKVLVFILADGWHAIIGSLAQSYR